MATNSHDDRAKKDALLALGLKRCPHRDCPANGEPQPVASFYRSATTRDLLTGWCKACCGRNTAKTAAAYRQTDAGKATARRAYERRRAEGMDAVSKARYRATEGYRDSMRAYRANPARKAAMEATRTRERAKLGARAVVNNAIAEGRFSKAATHPCDNCGQPAAEYHHHRGYDPAYVLDVLPLCVECHRLTDLRERAISRLAARSEGRAAAPPRTGPSASAIG